MAATGFSPVYLYASGTAGHIPLAANLTNTTNGSEIALNYADGNLFFKNASNSVITTPLLQASSSQNGWLSSTDWSTFNGKQAALVSGTNIKTVNGTSLLGSGDVGTIDVSHGGTGQTSFTTGYILIGNGTNGIGTNSNLQWDSNNAYLGVGGVPLTYFDVQESVSGAYTTTSSQMITRVLNTTNAGGINSAVTQYQCSTDGGGSNPVVRIGVAGEAAGSNNSSFIVQTRSAPGMTEVFRVSSAGNATVAGFVTAGNASDVLIGRYDATYPTSGAGYFKISTNNTSAVTGGMSIFTLSSGTFAESTRFHSSGGVSIGNTTDPGAGNLNVNTKMWVGTTSNVSGNATITSQAAASQSALVLGYSTAARMADFNNNGNLYLDIVNANTTASAANVYIDPTYAVMQRSTSSIKYKKNVQDATFGLDDVMKLRPVTYQGVGKFDSELTFGGLIAEEVDAAGLNMFVQYAEDGSPDSLAYGNMVAMAFKAIQQQQAMIVELQNKIAILENK